MKHPSGELSNDSALAGRIDFIVEIDALRGVFRKTRLISCDRLENSAEHSWHAATAAILLAKYADEPIDADRAVRMLLVHDIVEIDAGDTLCYDKEGNADKAEREQAAAYRIFALLPDEDRRDIRLLWEEFEARQTPEARFAAAIDRLMPLIHNYETAGAAWREHGITSEQVIERNRHIGDISVKLWDFARALIEDSVAKGYLKR